jgi:nitroimidazol reductase NimA-like FMN-containing flavoprotein (pyridoxamine 5'-phosphate oxidase superfamily)
MKNDHARRLQESSGLEELTVDECLRLLRTQQVGRLGVVVGGYPLIFPLNYGLDDDVVVIRTVLGQKLSGAQGTNVTFEVDELDPVHLSGWSVMIRGTAGEVTSHDDAETRERTERAAPTPWPAGEHPHLVRIIPRAMTGRRIRPVASIRRPTSPADTGNDRATPLDRSR